MTNVRPIDANALKDQAVEVDIVTLPHNHYCSELVVFDYDIDEAPTIDAVPVVRCEYCKEAVECQLYGEHCGLPSEKGIFCEVWQTVVDKNGYCYQGAKMDGGTSDGN